MKSSPDIRSSLDGEISSGRISRNFSEVVADCEGRKKDFLISLYVPA